MKIKDVMTESITCIKLNANVEKAAQLMKKLDIGSLPVCDNDQLLVGMVTDRDIVLRCVALGEDPKTLLVQDIMTVNPIAGDPEMDVDEAGRIMGDNQIRRLPIVDDGELVGVVSLGDLATKPNLKDEAGDILSEVSEPVLK